jgi:hypothetical protein
MRKYVEIDWNLWGTCPISCPSEGAWYTWVY